MRCAKRRFAVRLPPDLKPDKRAALIQIDTRFVNTAPDGKAFNRAAAASAVLEKVMPRCRSRSRPSRSMAAPSSRPSSNRPVRPKPFGSTSCRPKRPQTHGAVERCNGAWRDAFDQNYERLVPSMRLSILDNFQHLYDHPQAPRRPRRTNPGRLPQSAPSNRCPRHLICADPLIPDRGLSFSPGKPMIRDGRLRHGD
jgi:hypothetical protein